MCGAQFDAGSNTLADSTALRSLASLHFTDSSFFREDFGCLAGAGRLRSLSFCDCGFYADSTAATLSRLTQLESLAVVDCNRGGEDAPLAIGFLEPLTNLRSLDLRGTYGGGLDAQRLRQLQQVLAGLERLGAGPISQVEDVQLLASCIACTQLRFYGFHQCAEPAGAEPLLPSVSCVLHHDVLRLDPLLLRQGSLLTSLGLLDAGSDTNCGLLAGAFPQLRALMLGSPQMSAWLTPAGLAHLSRLPHLQQLCLVQPQLEPADLSQQLARLTGLRSLVIDVRLYCNTSRNPGDRAGEQPVSALEPALAALVAPGRRLRQLLLWAPRAWRIGQRRREELQGACDRVAAGCGRQEVEVALVRWDPEEAWERVVAWDQARP